MHSWIIPAVIPSPAPARQRILDPELFDQLYHETLFLLCHMEDLLFILSENRGLQNFRCALGAFIKEQRSPYSQPSCQRFQQPGSWSLRCERLDLCPRRKKWTYVCILLDFGAREIIGQSAGANKNAELYTRRFQRCRESVRYPNVSHGLGQRVR